MDSVASVIRPLLVILLLAAPALGFRVLSYFSDDPYLQPLDLTVEGLAKVGDGPESRHTTVEVNVGWGRQYSGAITQDHLKNVIATSLESQTSYYKFRFHDVPGRRINVSFLVGNNRYGPFAPGGMVDGIDAALIALRMTNGPD